MPSTYAHDCFGKAVYKQLPKEIQKEIKAYGPLYMPDRRQNSLNRHGRRERSCRRTVADLPICMDLSVTVR